MNKLFHILTIGLLIAQTAWAQDPMLTGTPIGSSPSFDYSSRTASTTVNLPANVFDGDLSTIFATNDKSYTWVGLDLGQPYIITKVAWSPRNEAGWGPQRTKLAVIEGANQPDFMDAIPLYVTDQEGVIGQYHSTNIDCSLGFRYVRWIGPHDGRCNLAELQFYGHQGAGNRTQIPMIAGIPSVVIHTLNNEEPYDKEHDIVSLVSMYGLEGQLWADSASVRLRGNASMQFEKKPYRVKFNKKRNVLGSPAKAKKWVLINAYGDKSLIRNEIAWDYAKRMGMSYVPFHKLVNVFLNGEYKGVYTLADQLEINPNRINITEMTPEDNAGEALTGGYHLEMDGYASDEPAMGWFSSNPYSMGITIKEPGSDEITTQQRTYISNHFSQMCQRVKNLSDWRGYLDETSFIQHFLVGELTGNTDTYWSMHMYKNRNNDTIYCGPEWDFDLGFDNDFRHYPTCNKSSFVYELAGTNKSFVSRILNDDRIANRSITRIWSDARYNRGLQPDTICALIDELATYLNEAQRLNFMRWNILSSNVHMNPRNPGGSYANEITFVKNYVRNRFAWMDNKVGLDENYKATSLEGVQNQPNDALIRIYNLQGFLLYEGTTLPALPTGFYIIQHDGQTEKLYIK